jgi:hypothetical protein
MSRDYGDLGDLLCLPDIESTGQQFVRFLFATPSPTPYFTPLHPMFTPGHPKPHMHLQYAAFGFG